MGRVKERCRHQAFVSKSERLDPCGVEIELINEDGKIFLDISGNPSEGVVADSGMKYVAAPDLRQFFKQYAGTLAAGFNTETITEFYTRDACGYASATPDNNGGKDLAYGSGAVVTCGHANLVQYALSQYKGLQIVGIFQLGMQKNRKVAIVP